MKTNKKLLIFLFIVSILLTLFEFIFFRNKSCRSEKKPDNETTLKIEAKSWKL